jgi:cell wall-associated NlpC family hydrolase
MDWYKGYRLVKDGDGYIVEIDLSQDSTEFSTEFLTNAKENLVKLDDQINKLVQEKFEGLKVNSVKLMVGGLMIAAVPLMSPAKVQAAEINTNTTQQTISQSTQAADMNTTGVVTASKLNVRSGPATSYSIIHALWQGNQVKVIGQVGDFYKIQLSDGSIGYVAKTYLQVDLRQQNINLVLATAKSLIGTPYVWGGESLQQGGFDCSGFTKYAFSQAGYSLNRVSTDQAKQGTYVPYENLQPGDLIFFSFSGNGVVNHVGIYIGNGKMIHSPATGETVKITDITTGYWQSRYVTARRIM